MIIFLREKFIAQIFMAIVAVIFVVGTIFLYSSTKDWFNKGTNDPVVLKVSGAEIRQSEFEGLVSNELERQKEQNQGRLEVNRKQVEQQVIDQIVQRQLLLNSVPISDAEIEYHIRSDSNLLASYNLYQQRGYGDLFRQDVRLQMSFESVSNQIQGLALVTDTEVENEYRRQNDKAKLKYIQFQNYEYNNAIKVEESEAQTYFELHKEKYKTEERINLRFVKLDPKGFVSDRDVQAYYNEHSREFATPEVVKARHILKKFPDNATDAQKAETKKQAEALLKTVREAVAGGTDFAELAKRYSDDTGSAAQGGALRGNNPKLPPGDYFARGEMVPPFEKTCFDQLTPGEIGDLVETDYGYHIIKLEEKRPSEIQPFDQARWEIRNKLIQITGADKAKMLASDLLFDVEIQDYEAAVQLDRYKDYHLTVQDTGLFTQDESNIPKIGSKWTYRGLTDKAFNIEVNVSDIIETKTSNGDIEAYFVAKVLEKQPAASPEFETVKAKVIDDLKLEKAKQMALNDAKRLFSLRSAGESLEDLVKKYSAPEGVTKKEREVKESNPFAISPGSDYVPGMGTCREAMFASFEMKLNEVRGPFQGDSASYIIQLVEREEPDMAKFKNDLAEQLNIRKSVLQSKRNVAYTNWFNALKKGAKIVDNRRQSG